VGELIHEVEAAIRERALLRSGKSILVAVSGGVDSIVLLDLLHRLSKKNRWELAVAHLNHQLRGKESDRDEALVRRVAGHLGLPALIERADVRELMRREKISLEMAARKARHLFLARAARQRGTRTIALAHHADDQLELFFLRLLRGSGSEGLSGMEWENASPVDPQLQLVRPLLGVSKADLKRYAEETRLECHEDATNRSLHVLRNRIRYELLPLLRKKYQPGLSRVIGRAMILLQAEAEFMGAAAERACRQMQQIKSRTKQPKVFDKLHPAIQRRLIQKQLVLLSVIPNFDLVESLRMHVLKPVCLPPGPGGNELALRRTEAGKVELISMSKPAFDSGSIELTADVTGKNGTLQFATIQIKWRQQQRRVSNSRFRRNRKREYFDADRVGKRIILRHWRPGDRFEPIGMASAVKLQDFFTNEKISRAKRHQLVLATTAAGEIFWIEGMRISDRFKLTKRTKRSLEWGWEML